MIFLFVSWKIRIMDIDQTDSNVHICLYCNVTPVDDLLNTSPTLTYDVSLEFPIKLCWCKLLNTYLCSRHFHGSLLFRESSWCVGGQVVKSGCSWTMIMRFPLTTIGILSWWMYNKITEQMLPSTVVISRAPRSKEIGLSLQIRTLQKSTIE